MKDDQKLHFTRTASNNNGGIQINIPPALVKHLNIQPGDKIKLQSEHNQQHGKYASFWNPKQQNKNQDDHQ